MSGKQDYLTRQRQLRQAYIQATADTYVQHTMDCVMIVLHREFGWGQQRLEQLGRQVDAARVQYDGALDPKNPECGYTQTCMDRALQEALGDRKIVPFTEQYKWLKGAGI